MRVARCNRGCHGSPGWGLFQHPASCMRLILASTSPRRRELLALLQIPFETMVPTFVEELQPDLQPDQLVSLYAEGKARSCAEQFPDALVLGSDTVITLDHDLVGKPKDANDARAILWRLRGREHRVLTGVALVSAPDGVREIGIEEVRVWMRPYSREEMEQYVLSGECRDKAGAYAIQGAGGDLVQRIEGDFTATVGLPLRRVITMLRKGGCRVRVDVEGLYRERPYPNWVRFA